MESWFKDKSIDIRNIVEKYPLIQIAIPIYFDKWNGEKLPVIYLPYDFNEGETELINGFYNNEPISFKINEKPDYPVVVISQNERTEILAKAPPHEIDVPINLTATAGPDGITLNWKMPNIDYNISGYKIYKTDGVFPTKTYITFGKDKTSYFDYNVETEINYTYYVVAFLRFPNRHYISEDNVFDLVDAFSRFMGDCVYSEPSNTASAVIYRDYPANTLVISNPVKKNELTLNWGHLTYNPQNFEVWRRAGGDAHYNLYSTINGNVSTFKNEHLPAANLYHYKVRALV